MQVAKWGNSLAVRLPAAVVEALELKAGDEVEIVKADSESLTLEKRDRREDFLRRMAAFRWPAPEDDRFDRDEANER